MFKKTLAIMVALVLATAVHGGLRIAGNHPDDIDASTPGTNLAAGTTMVTLSLQYVNETGGQVSLLGAQVLNYGLSSSFYGGSGATAPTLVASDPGGLLPAGVPFPSSGFVELGLTSPNAPLGTLAANNFIGFSLQPGHAVTLGSLKVNIPSDFLGEFILTSTTGEQFASILVGGSEQPDSLGTSVTTNGTTTVGTGTVVPEPSSFLFLGLVGTAALGLRRYRRATELEGEDG